MFVWTIVICHKDYTTITLQSKILSMFSCKWGHSSGRHIAKRIFGWNNFVIVTKMMRPKMFQGPRNFSVIILARMIVFVAETFQKSMESQTRFSNGCLVNCRIGGCKETRQSFANPSPTLCQPFANLSPTLCQPFLPTPLQTPLSVEPRHWFRNTG